MDSTTDPGTRTGASGSATTRQLILDAAAARFAEQGFRQTSVSAVARELSISPSAVYFHFANKEQLFLAAYDRQAGQLADAIFAGESQPIGDGYWQSIILVLVQQMSEYPLVMRVVRGREPELLPRLATGELSMRMRAEIAVSLRLGQEVGRIRMDIDRERVAAALESILLALLVTAVQTGGAAAAERAAPVAELLTMAIEVRGT